MELEEQQARYKEFGEAYSDDFLEECLNDLQVDSEFHDAMKSALVDAGKIYILSDNLSRMYVPAREVRSKFDTLYKPLNKLKETYLEVWENSVYDFAVLFLNAQRGYNKNKDTYKSNQLIADFMRFGPENFYLAYGEFIGFLKFLDNSTSEISENIRGHDIKGVVPVEKWLRKLKPEWEQYSPVEFVAGMNYGGSIGHNSDAVIILYKLMHQMDPNITKSRIGNTLERLIKGGWEKI